MAITRGDINATLKDLTMIAEDSVIMTRPNLLPLIANMGPEEGAYTRVPIPANLPFPRKFEGERQEMGKDVAVVQTYNQDTYELTIDLDSDLIRNAKAYDYNSLVREATMSAVLFPDYLASQAVIGGGAAKAYDGVNFYGATHKYAGLGANTINNTIAKTGQTVPTLAADISSCLVALRTFKDNQGRLLNQLARQGTSQLLIHCPVALEQAFRQVLFGSMIPMAVGANAAASAANNQLQGIADLYPDGYLDSVSPTTWYMHYVGMPQRALIYRENYGLQVSVLGFGSEFEINTNKVRIALKQRFVLGYHRFDRSVRVA